MKTIRQLLQENLSKEDFNKALKYSDITWESPEKDFQSALRNAFLWSATKEGHFYWMDICVEFDMIKDSIVESIVEEFKKRSDVGIKKYNTTLDRTDLTELEWRIHHQQELMDAILYNQKIINILKSRETEKIK